LNLMFFDHNKDHSLDWAKVFYANSTAMDVLWGIAIHWYSGDQFDIPNAIHQQFPSKHIMATEACNCGGPHYHAWDRAESYAHDIIGDLNVWVRGWTDWNILLDQQGGPNHVNNFCDAPLIARFDLSPVSLVYQDTYYALGHFARFLPEGSIRIANTITGSAPNLEYVTFSVSLSETGDSWTKKLARGQGAASTQIVTIILNRQNTATAVQIQAGSWYATVHIPAHSLHTLLFDASILNGKQATLQLQ